RRAIDIATTQRELSSDDEGAKLLHGPEVNAGQPSVNTVAVAEGYQRNPGRSRNEEVFATIRVAPTIANLAAEVDARPTVGLRVDPGAADDIPISQCGAADRQRCTYCDTRKQLAHET